MGFYSLWQPYRILNLGVPEFVEARPNNDAIVNEQHVSDGGHVSLVGLPKASTVRWRHPATADRPSVDTFWYDGGMKPQTPEELYEDNEDLADEGMLFIGDKGKILCDFRANKPAPHPEEPAESLRGIDRARATSIRRRPTMNGWGRSATARSPGAVSSRSRRSRRRSRSQPSHCGCPYKRLLWDAAAMAFTNSPEATKLVRRQQYREGWET